MQFITRYAVAHWCVPFDWTVYKENEAALADYLPIGTKPFQGNVYFRLAGEHLARFATNGGAEDVEHEGG